LSRASFDDIGRGHAMCQKNVKAARRSEEQLADLSAF
jgi:hypothetical protein